MRRRSGADSTGRRHFRLPASESTVERDIDDEVAFHIEERVAALIARGVAPADARRRAEQEFGDIASARSELASIDRETLRRERRAEWWSALFHDLRHAVRGMRRNPAFTTAVVLTLALGIGVNAAMFGITDRLLLSPPPHVVAADEVVRVLYEHTLSSGERAAVATVSYADYVRLRDDVPPFRTVAAYSGASRSVLGAGESGVPVRVVSATWTLFPTLGVQPALGRFFAAGEDAVPRGANVVILSHGLWQSRFGGDANVLGSMIEIDHASYEVVGVAPAGFTGMELSPVHAWVPASTTGARTGGDDWYAHHDRMHWLRIVARLAPGADLDVARQQATAVFLPAHATRFAGDTTAGVVLGSAIVARAPPVGSGIPQRSGRIALWLLGVSLLVVVIACANVANLLLARGMRRRREIGVRMALGVGRFRLAWQTLVETLVIALVGAALGLLFAHWAGHFARTLLLPDMEWAGSAVSRRVLLVAAAATIGSTVLAGLVPALHAGRGDAGSLLGLGGRHTYRRSPLRSGLVALQATLSVLLLVGAGLFVRSLREVSAVPLGFDPDRVATFGWHRTGLDWDRQRVHALYDAGLVRVASLPHVEAAAIALTEPMWSTLHGFIRVPGQDSVPRSRDLVYTAVSTDYFRTVGARVLRGRAFTDRDVPGSEPVVIVTAALAALLWPGGDALGSCFVHEDEPGAPCREVVGIVEDTRYSTVLGDPSLMYYLPITQFPGFSMRSLLVRTSGDTDVAIAGVRAALQSLEPGLPFVQAYLLRDRVAPQLQPWRLGAVLFTAFGVLALLLAAIGLYGVVAYDVAQRRREIGVRTALGARAASLVRMVLGDAVRVVALGVIVGLAVAGWAARYIEPLLFEISPRDPAVLTGVAALLLVIGALAAALPAWRAARVQPTEALRED